MKQSPNHRGLVTGVQEKIVTKLFCLLQRSKIVALDAKKEAESALNSVKGSFEKITSDFLKKSKAVKEDGKKKTNETVSNIHANGHSVAAGKGPFLPGICQFHEKAVLGLC